MDLCKSVVSETCVTRTCLNRKIVAAFVVGILATSIAASFAFNEFMLSGEIKGINEKEKKLVEKISALYDADALKDALDNVADKIDQHKGNFDEKTLKEIKRDLERIKSKSDAAYTRIFNKPM